MKRHLATLTLAFLTLGALSLSAQDQQPGAPPPDQDYSQQADQSGPAPGVARVSVAEGSVSSQRGDNGQWVAVTVNTPISVGDRVSTGPDGRAELQLDSANVLRLSSSATAKIQALSRENVQVQVGLGLVTYSVVRPGEANAEIDTPNAAVHPDGPGEYRIQVNSDSETEVIVRSGSADITEPQGSTHVNAGELITIQGTDSPQYKTTSAPAQDAWDSWNMGRDRQITSAKSWHDTNPYYTGSEDLDNYGTWSEVPDYGPVWIPQQTPNWAPYSSGRWVWQPYYGWTWVSYEPWGWAPYHYGRWFVYGGNWVWWPGPVVGYPAYYPIWAPAYVSFFGWGGGGWGFGIGFGFGWGFGHVGWLPCGPGDWYHPWWGRGGGRYYATSITNIHNTSAMNNGFRPLGPRGERSFSNVNEAFRNDRVRSGMVSMDSGRFGRDAVHGVGSRMSEASFRQASMVSGRMPISPSRESFSSTGRAPNPASFHNAPPASQHFFSTAGRAGSSGFASHAVNSNASTRESFGATNARGAQSLGNESRSPITSSRPGWHTFTPPQSGSNRGEAGSSFNRGGTVQSENSGGFQHFSQQPQESNRDYPSNRSFHSPETASRGGYSDSYSHSYSRPQLNMRQPIVTPRGGGSYRGAYSSPRGSGGYSAPRGSYSEPRGGGHQAGGSRGGGGGHSGGGHSHR